MGKILMFINNMLQQIKERIFPFIIALSALSVSASAAFYSVTGLSMLFAGASFAIIIMASSLEVSKLVIASLLYQYWSNINTALKYYLTIALFILIIITSAGIYGYLSAAYQTNADKTNIVEQQVVSLTTKKQLFEQTRDNHLKDKQLLTQSISSLREALYKGTTNQYTDSKGNLVITTNTSNRKAFEKQLESTTQEESKLSSKIDIINDSIFALENHILEVKTSQVTNELGPLKYLSTLTGKPMDKIINWYILVIIFVFDPLAIALVIAANFAFAKLKKTSTPDLMHKGKEPDPILDNPKTNKIAESIQVLDEMHQNTDYDFQWKKDKVSQEINNIKKLLKDDDTITYF